MNVQEMLNALRAKQEADRAELERLLEEPSTMQRDLTDDEATRFDEIEARMDARSARIEQLERQVQVDEANAAAERQAPVGGAVVTAESGPYTPDSARNGGPSFFRDLHLTKKGDGSALERLQRNVAHRAAYAERAISTGNGAGGEFVPPLWLEDEFVKFVRPGRKTANICTNDRLPEGTDSINIPKINSGTATALQATQNNGVQQTDLTTTSVSSAVYTVAGGQTVSMQLIEQSPLNIDQVVLQDLAQDYAKQLDVLVLSGTGSGQPTGILNQSGINSVTYTDASPALMGAGKLYAKIANAIELIETTRYASPTHIVMHPRRWWWLSTQTDSNNRPAVLPASNGLYNAAGIMAADQQPEGVVGDLLGLPVVTDANIPTNLGGTAGTQDVIVVAKFDDLWLWEGQVKAEAFEQTYAQNLSLFVRLYNYLSFQPGRYAQSISTVTGTGLVAPTF